MGRSRLRIGEHGVISYTRTPNGWTARTKYRCSDDVVRNRQASGPTKQAARFALDDLLSGQPKGLGGPLTGDATIPELAAAWLADLEENGNLSGESLAYYRRGVETLVLAPYLGLSGFQLWELRPVYVKMFYQRLLFVEGPDGEPKRVPSRPVWGHKVLSLMLRYAVEVGALDSSPTRDIRAPRRKRKEVRVLSMPLLHEIRAAVTEFDQRPTLGSPRSHDLLDVFDVLAGTGARISEALALRWQDVDLESTPMTVSICGTLLPPRDGLPVRRVNETKTISAMRTLSVPDFTAKALLRLHRRAADTSPDAPVFATKNGTWLSPTNVRREWRLCRKGQDWDWVTPHTFRKTVATLIHDHYSDPANSGGSSTGTAIAAAVLGHSSEEVTRSYYIAPTRWAPDATAALEPLRGRLPRDEPLRAKI